MGNILMGMLCALLVASHAYAAEPTVNIVTTDGRTFDSLTPVDIETLSAQDKAAYQLWQAGPDTETSTYQQSEGPNTMDISSDFSM